MGRPGNKSSNTIGDPDEWDCDGDVTSRCILLLCLYSTTHLVHIHMEVHSISVCVCVCADSVQNMDRPHIQSVT